MKVSSVIFLLTCYVAVQSFPAKPEGKDEIEIVPLENQGPNFAGPAVIDTGAWEAPFSNPFDGLFQSLEGIMTRMREQMSHILGRVPVGNGTQSGSPFPGLQFPQLDLNKGNTTSVTKVIDGHKVVINETEYKQEGDLGGTFFKVRIIDVKPDSSELTTEKDAEEVTTPKSNKQPEAIENSFENEITKNKENEVPNFNNIETFDEVDTFPAFQKLSNSETPEWNSIEPIELVEDNSLPNHHEPIDLSHDIYVNQIMADAGAPINPDAEFVEVSQTRNDGTSRQPQIETIRTPQQFEKIINPR